jgi:hypothetical protein
VFLKIGYDPRESGQTRKKRQQSLYIYELTSLLQCVKNPLRYRPGTVARKMSFQRPGLQDRPPFPEHCCHGSPAGLQEDRRGHPGHLLGEQEGNKNLLNILIF